MIRFTLPWPPSVNNYWHRNGKTIYVSKRGKEFRNEVYYLCRQYKDAFDCDAALAMFIWVYPPDKRKRDLDNLLKATCDSLEYVGVFPDDSQIRELHMLRMPELRSELVIQLHHVVKED